MPETLQWTDTFTGANGSSADSTYWAFMAGGSIQNNKYSVDNPASAFSGINLFAQSSQTPTDHRVQLELKLPSLVDAYFIFTHHFGGTGVEIEWNISAGTIYYNGGGTSGSMISFTPATDTLVLSYQALGTAYEVKVWKLGDPMPGTPLIAWTTTAAGTGQFMMQMKTGGAGAGFTWTIDNVTMYSVTAGGGAT